MRRAALFLAALAAGCGTPPEAWFRAPALGPFVGPFNPGGPDLAARPEYRTEARIVWEPQVLRFAFRCRGPAWFSEFRNHDDRLHEADVAEIFIDVAGDMREVAEFQASPRGVTADYYHTWAEPPSYPADRVDWKQESRLRKGVKEWDLEGFRAAAEPLVEGGVVTGWSVEMTVPVGEIMRRRGLPESLSAGRTFRVNLLRYVWEPGASGKRVHRQLNLVKTMKGCPHVSPMAMVTLRCDADGAVRPADGR